ncbi:hypothetical protein EV200_105338 [Pedobacter psychrotolerans]|uniref:Uncharacterized protein n=1 Tax=Pedobacter psychrotolerans TaxID=1843235 RepID=A0A4R2HBU7_9SPHI|nr:hypothetical protein EV200_105338 [Pedobacter psychrotolerans]GGE63170.1 hypothetical protein GCM10011413_31960 [Pedobacter psychrotolerans]
MPLYSLFWVISLSPKKVLNNPAIKFRSLFDRLKLDPAIIQKPAFLIITDQKAGFVV